jgi:hypothetical protein
MASPSPTKKSVSDIKSALFRPALTSHFQVYITPPSGSEKFFEQNEAPRLNDDRLMLWCSDASLPGSSFLTHESNNDFHGTTERFAYRRAYDDRIDLGFYVDAENHYTIRFFEAWMKYISDESVAGYSGGRPGTKDPTYFYRFRYPDQENQGYRYASALSVTKFERDYKRKLVYEFIKPYPISFQSIPISYESSSLLKCTVSMTYTRYIVSSDNNVVIEQSEPGQSTSNGVSNNPFSLTLEQQAQFNSAYSQNLNFGNLSAGTLTNTNFDPSSTTFNSQVFSGNLNLL